MPGTKSSKDRNAAAKPLLKALDELGINKAEAARRCQMKLPQISRLTNPDAHAPSVRTLRRVAAGLDMELHIKIIEGSDAKR